MPFKAAVVFCVDSFRCSQMCVVEFPPLTVSAARSDAADCTPRPPGTLAALSGGPDYTSDRLTLIWTGGEGPGGLEVISLQHAWKGGKCDGPLSAGPHARQRTPGKETQTGRKYKNAHGRVMETQLEAQL